MIYIGESEDIDKAKEGHSVDALALRGDEGRDKLRKAAGIGKYDLIRRYPNGATRQACLPPSKDGANVGN